MDTPPPSNDALDHQDCDQTPASVAHFGGDNHGNVAGNQYVDKIEFKTFIRIEGGAFAPIEKATTAQLDCARIHLLRLIMKHEVFALGPVMLTVGVMLLCWAFLNLLITLTIGVDLSQATKVLILSVSALCSIPFWFGCYDVRRRHRRVVEQAEQRWAAIIVELGERGEGKPYESVWQGFKRWRAETRRAKR